MTRSAFPDRTGSRRDAQQRGAAGAPHDDDYPGLSRITLNQAERFGSQHGRKCAVDFRIISALFGSRTLALRIISDHNRGPEQDFGSFRSFVLARKWAALIP
jgi:hypothetical protein